MVESHLLIGHSDYHPAAGRALPGGPERTSGGDGLQIRALRLPSAGEHRLPLGRRGHKTRSLRAPLTFTHHPQQLCATPTSESSRQGRLGGGCHHKRKSRARSTTTMTKIATDIKTCPRPVRLLCHQLDNLAGYCNTIN